MSRKIEEPKSVRYETKKKYQHIGTGVEVIGYRVPGEGHVKVTDGSLIGWRIPIHYLKRIEENDNDKRTGSNSGGAALAGDGGPHPTL